MSNSLHRDSEATSGRKVEGHVRVRIKEHGNHVGETFYVPEKNYKECKQNPRHKLTVNSGLR